MCNHSLMNDNTELPNQQGTMAFSEKSIHKIVSILKWYYFVFVCLGGFALLAGLFVGYKLPQLFHISGIFLIPSLIYLGLKKRKSWVIILVVVQCVLNIAFAFFTTGVTPQNSLGPVAGTLIKITGVVMAVFQLYFFTRKEVRKYFKATDVIIY